MAITILACLALAGWVAQGTPDEPIPLGAILEVVEGRDGALSSSRRTTLLERAADATRLERRRIEEVFVAALSDSHLEIRSAALDALPALIGESRAHDAVEAAAADLATRLGTARARVEEALRDEDLAAALAGIEREGELPAALLKLMAEQQADYARESVKRPMPPLPPLPPFGGLGGKDPEAERRYREAKREHDRKMRAHERALEAHQLELTKLRARHGASRAAATTLRMALTDLRACALLSTALAPSKSSRSAKAFDRLFRSASIEFPAATSPLAQRYLAEGDVDRVAFVIERLATLEEDPPNLLGLADLDSSFGRPWRNSYHGALAELARERGLEPIPGWNGEQTGAAWASWLKVHREQLGG